MSDISRCVECGLYVERAVFYFCLISDDGDIALPARHEHHSLVARALPLITARDTGLTPGHGSLILFTSSLLSPVTPHMCRLQTTD